MTTPGAAVNCPVRLNVLPAATSIVVLSFSARGAEIV
jgi:hypothetical protein